MSAAAFPSAPPRDATAARWRATLAAGLAPIALAGFAAAAIADRPIFALWSLASAALVTLVLHRAAGRNRGPRLAAALAALAAAWLGFALLALRYAADWELGLRALAPALDASWTTSARTPFALAAALALAALICWRKEA